MAGIINTFVQMLAGSRDIGDFYGVDWTSMWQSDVNAPAGSPLLLMASCGTTTPGVRMTSPSNMPARNTNRPAWVDNPGDKFILAESSCQHFLTRDSADLHLKADALNRAVSNKCGSVDDKGVNVMGVMGKHIEACQTPEGSSGWKMYLRIVKEGIMCK